MLIAFGNNVTDDKVYQHAYQKLHYQFVASARAVKIAHALDPNYVVGNMICGIVDSLSLIHILFWLVQI